MNNRAKLISLVLAILVLASAAAFAVYDAPAERAAPAAEPAPEPAEASAEPVRAIDSYDLAAVAAMPDIKANIYNNMLNSVDFYNGAEGTLLTSFAVDGELATVEFSVDIPAQRSYEHIRSDSTDMELAYGDDRVFTRDNRTERAAAGYAVSQLQYAERAETPDADICLDHGAKAAFQTSDGPAYERAVQQTDGTMAYYYRADLTNTAVAQQNLFPQALTLALLRDFGAWEISDVQTFLGRRAVVLTGEVASRDYAEKIGSESFRMIVDIETGILLSFEGYAADGERSQQMEITELTVYRSGVALSVGARAESAGSSICADLEMN